MKADIRISESNTQEVALILNKLLADEHILLIKTRNYHWNIEGSNFMEMHKFYETLYTELDAIIDEVAERVRMIGHYAEGRLKDFLKLTNLEEEEYTSDQQRQLRHLLDDHQTLIHLIRNQIEAVEETYKDAGTADFLTGLLKKHEQWAWMLRAYLK
ncbi:Dps family protein [Larkinella bovis]|uniref:Dps family protein n=1 Tax=Larkinella bovis TaxID=683041 RepID=A0ABW0INZ4_9BACT